MRAMILPSGSSHCSFSAEEGKQVQILREHVAVKRFLCCLPGCRNPGKAIGPMPEKAGSIALSRNILFAETLVAAASSGRREKSNLIM